MNVVEIDRGWKRIKKQMAEAGGVGVKIGLQAGEPPREDPDDPTTVMVGFYNEFGTDTIPERSFIRSTADENRTRYQNIIDRNFRERILTGRTTVGRLFAEIGELVQSDIQMKITNISEPPNAISTIIRKGSSNPLIDTAAMRNSIRYVVEGVGPLGAA